MSELVGIITARDPVERNRSLDAWCRQAPSSILLDECAALDAFRRASDNLYERVRAGFFLYAIHRFHLPFKPGMAAQGLIPFSATAHVLNRRFEQAIELLLRIQRQSGPSAPVSSGLAAAYRGLAFQTLANQVRLSVRSFRGNNWLSRTGHPEDYPLALRGELLARDGETGMFPILREVTPVRMDLSHSGWSDIFFLGMDFPEGARVLNISIDLCVRGSGREPAPPVEAWVRVIDEPVLRLASVDLEASATVTSLAEVFDFGRDYLGLLKAAVIASGIVPPAMEGSEAPMTDLLARLTGRRGHGLEVASRVNDIPKGSRLAVSTSLLACLIAACMRATGQIRSLAGPLKDEDRRLVAARAILGEWLGGSGGGWQDSGGLWPGVKLICGVEAAEGDPEHGVSRGRLLPRHHVFACEEVTAETRRALQRSLVLAHGGMAQDVGPILEMVTEKYLLRSEAEWQARMDAMRIFDELVEHLRNGAVAELGPATERNFFGPIQTIIPWATNFYTESIVGAIRGEFGAGFRGFWMLGGMSGGGMGFLFTPESKPAAHDRLQPLMREIKGRIETAVPFAMEPVVYDFAINERGSWADILSGSAALMPAGYYANIVPGLIRVDPRLLSSGRRAELECFGRASRTLPAFAGSVQSIVDRLLPGGPGAPLPSSRTLESLLDEHGFDRIVHAQIQADLRAGRIGLLQNRLPAASAIEDAASGDVENAISGLPARYAAIGREALAEGAVTVVTLAGGAGTRWTRGAGVVKAINPFWKAAGRHRNFVEVHLAKSRRTARCCGTPLPHVITTSYLTHEAIAGRLTAESRYGYAGPLLLSPGRAIGLRLVPMVRDLRFAWEEVAQQVLDERQQKMRESVRAALIHWAEAMGEGSNYTDNVPAQCLHPVGHWYELPNMLRNGVLLSLLRDRPGLKHLMLHNVDTLGAGVDPAILGWHIANGAAMTVEVISRHLEDRGGGLARVDGRLRLVEGLALPDEEVEASLTWYNSATMWVSVDRLLQVFGLDAGALEDQDRVAAAVRAVALRMPTYITLKDVKKRWGKGQEDVYPVCQFEKLWGDMTALPDLDCRFLAVPRFRGQQLKEPAQLDGWLRDGSAAYVESLCDWPA
jgi:hypothetical protein